MISEIYGIDIRALLVHDKDDTSDLYAKNQTYVNYHIKRNQKLSANKTNLNKFFIFGCTGENFRVKSFKSFECVLANSQLKDSLLEHSTLESTNFTNCKFNKINISHTLLKTMRFLLNIENINFKNCNFVNCIYSNETFKDSKFIDCKISNCSYDKTIYSSNEFQNCELNKVIFFNSSFYSCKFNNVSFKDGTYRKCNFVDCTFDEKSYETLRRENIKLIRPKVI
jgi:uncharacterized protein YjbI with pentapeptide repeats